MAALTARKAPARADSRTARISRYSGSAERVTCGTEAFRFGVTYPPSRARRGSSDRSGVVVRAEVTRAVRARSYATAHRRPTPNRAAKGRTNKPIDFREF